VLYNRPLAKKIEPISMITFRELILLKTDILESSNVKYVRHKDSRKEYRDLIKDRDELLEYQRDQKNDVFNGCDYIVSFFGQESTKALRILKTE